MILPEKGLMTITAHAGYSGKNQILLSPILNLVGEVYASGKYWITSLQEVAAYWRQRNDLKIGVKEEGSTVTLKIELPEGIVIENLSLKLPTKPQEFRLKEKAGELKEIDGDFYLIFDARNGEVAQLQF